MLYCLLEFENGRYTQRLLRIYYTFSKTRLIENIFTLSGVEKGEGSKWGHAPWGAGLGAHQHTFFSHLKTRLKQKCIPKRALKCVFFEKKNCKNRLSVGGFDPEPPFGSGG